MCVACRKQRSTRKRTAEPKEQAASIAQPANDLVHCRACDPQYFCNLLVNPSDDCMLSEHFWDAKDDLKLSEQPTENKDPQ